MRVRLFAVAILAAAPGSSLSAGQVATQADPGPARCLDSYSRRVCDTPALAPLRAEMAHKFAAVLATDNRTATWRARQAEALREITEARDYAGKPLSDDELAERFRDQIAELDKALAQASGVRAMVKTLESWRDALPTRLPKGFGIWKGVDYDFEGLGASSKLWRDKDANCCPSGGDALIDFAIEGRSLVLKDVRVDIVERWRPRRTD